MASENPLRVGKVEPELRLCEVGFGVLGGQSLVWGGLWSRVLPCGLQSWTPSSGLWIWAAGYVSSEMPTLELGSFKVC